MYWYWRGCGERVIYTQQFFSFICFFALFACFLLFVWLLARSFVCLRVCLLVCLFACLLFDDKTPYTFSLVLPWGAERHTLRRHTRHGTLAQPVLLLRAVLIARRYSSQPMACPGSRAIRTISSWQSSNFNTQLSRCSLTSAVALHAPYCKRWRLRLS